MDKQNEKFVREFKLILENEKFVREFKLLLENEFKIYEVIVFNYNGIIDYNFSTWDYEVRYEK